MEETPWGAGENRENGGRNTEVSFKWEKYEWRNMEGETEQVN